MFFAFFSKAQLNVGTGLYEFADETDLFKNSAIGTGTGTIMCEGVFKFDSTATDNNLDDMASTELTDYMISSGINNNAISLKAHNWFKVWHGIPANGGSNSWVNDFTVVIDVRVADMSGIYSLVEVNPTPKATGYTSEMEIANGKVGTLGAPVSDAEAFGYSDNTLTADTWYRITYVAKLGEYIKVFVNGELWHSMEGNFTDGRPSLYGSDSYPGKAAMKICGNNEAAPDNNPPRDGDKDVDMIAIFGNPLTDVDVAILGNAGDGTSGIKQLMVKYNSLSIFPNPASDVINVVVKNYSKLELINTIGQVVKSYTVNGNTTIDISSFNKGIYFAKITDINGNTISKKLVIE